MENCGTCKWWGGGKEEENGVCRRFPPTPIMMQMPEVGIGEVKMITRMNSYFPTTRGTTPACGEFKTKEAEA